MSWVDAAALESLEGTSVSALGLFDDVMLTACPVHAAVSTGETSPDCTTPIVERVAPRRQR